MPTWLIGLFQTLVPALLLAMLALSRQPSRVRWALTALAFGLTLAFLWATSRWELISVYLRPALPPLFIVASLVGYRRITPPSTLAGRGQAAWAVGVNVLLIVAMAGLCWRTFRGFGLPPGSVDLASPLRGVEYLVLHGGASPFINAHAKVRPQNHALDLLGLNRWGARADPLAGQGDLEGYALFGAPVYSPCDGRITAAEGGLEDLIPPATDPKHPAGNHVLIECQGIEVLLAHLRAGSLRVQVGDPVTTETLLGAVGNTGNTSEPHLHIHGERGGTPGVILDGVAVPITLDGRWLIRGDRGGT